MKKKCRKLLALLTMLAVIVTYSFSASIVSVYAEDEQGDANAKATASEEVTPDKPDPKPQAEPEKPAPSESNVQAAAPENDKPDNTAGGNDAVSEGPADVDGPADADKADTEDGQESADVDQNDAAAVPEEEQVEEAFAAKGDTTSTNIVLEYGETCTLKTAAQGKYKYDQWSVSKEEPGWAYIGFNPGTHAVTNNNGTSSVQNAKVVHKYRNSHKEEWQVEEFNITLNPQTFDVTFMLKDAGSADFAVEKTDKVVRGGQATPPDLPASKEVDGKTYKLYSWFSDEGCTKTASLNNIYGKKTVYGKYAAIEKITFKKNLNGQAVTLPETIEAGAGTTVYLGSAVCDGWTFTGWKAESGQDYLPNAYIEMPEGGLTLYAQWAEGAAKTTHIFYHDNYSMGYDIVHTDKVDANSRVTLWDGAPKHSEFYIFRGWSTNPKAVIPQYYPGGTFNVGTHHADLYAVWGLVDFDVKSVTLEAYGKTVTYDGTKQTVEIGVKPYNGNSVDKFGFILIGHHKGSFCDPSYDIYAYVGHITASGIDAGQYSAPVSAPLYYKTKNSCAMCPIPGYFASVKNALLIINPAEVVINTNSAKKVYDGTELTAGGTVSFGDGQSAEFTPEGEAVKLFADDTLNIRATGSQTEVGSSENGFEFDWGKPDDWGTSASTAKKHNYTITAGEAGTLTVTPKTGILTFNLSGGNYNGNTADVVMECVVGDVITIPDAPTRDGFVFVEWRGSSYQPGDKFTVEGDHDFTAIWAVANTDDQNDDSDKGSGEVETGDSFGLLGLLAMMGAAILGLLGLTMIRRDEE